MKLRYPELAWRAAPDTFAYTVSNRRYKLYPHVEYISERISQAVARGGGRLIVNMPPGHFKSSILSYWTPTWVLDNDPKQRVICSSHSDELAHYWGRMVRNEFDNNPMLTTKLRQDSTAADRWNTVEGGGMVSKGVGGGITGFRANLILVDDPHPTWEEAMSKTQRDAVRDWFLGTLYDRKEPGATIVVLMHRWHDEDLAGYLISQHADPWDVIRLPALAEPNDPLGRKEGAALCPERYDRETLLQDKRSSPIVFAAKYQQKPEGLGTERVYDAYVPAVHDDKEIELDTSHPLCLDFDFNRNPGMHVLADQYFPKEDVFYVCNEFFAPFLKLRPALDMIGKWMADTYGYAYGCEHETWFDAKRHSTTMKFPFPLVEVYADATGKQDRAETVETAIDMVLNWMLRHKWPVKMRVPVKNPPQLERTDTVNDALADGDGESHVLIHPTNCPRLVTDLKTLKTDEHGLIDKDDEKLSHASDAFGYHVHYVRPVRRGAGERKPKGSGTASVLVASR